MSDETPEVVEVPVEPENVGGTAPVEVPVEAPAEGVSEVA